MDLPEVSSPHDKKASASGGSAPCKAPLAEPSKSAQPSTSQQQQQQNNNPRPAATTPTAAAHASGAQDHYYTQSRPGLSPSNGWDGVIIDTPSFPLTEVVALVPLRSTDRFFGYARRNGRVGFIMEELMDGRMRETARNAVAQFAQIEAEVARAKPKGKAKAREQAGARAAPRDIDATAGSGQATTKTEIPSQTFEQICGGLVTHIQSIDAGCSTEGEKQRNRVCIEAVKAVSERAKALGEQRFKSHATANTPPATDPESYCVVPLPPPFFDGEPCGRPMPCLKHFTRVFPRDGPPFTIPKVNVENKKAGSDGPEVQEDELLKATKHLGAAADKAAGGQANKDGQAQTRATYSWAAKAAARYYATTSAYGRPLEVAAGEDAAVDLEECAAVNYGKGPGKSLEMDPFRTKLEMEKHAKIHEAIWETLHEIQFYNTVTSLLLVRTDDGHLHVRVTEVDNMNGPRKPVQSQQACINLYRQITDSCKLLTMAKPRAPAPANSGAGKMQVVTRNDNRALPNVAPARDINIITTYIFAPVSGGTPAATGLQPLLARVQDLEDKVEDLQSSYQPRDCAADQARQQQRQPAGIWIVVEEEKEKEKEEARNKAHRNYAVRAFGK
ncbi:hypothetical protein diail_10341 [Diaporthe ilicicola]|nr:hypothetical protein diail_10341 [Diaporthe ilicicola]